MGSTFQIPATMRAAQYHASDNQVHVNTVPVPKPKPYELLVKTLCCSLCRSDLMNFESDEVGIKPKGDNVPPITMGHEAAGVIVGVGPDCGTKFKIGDEVGFLPSANVCFECEGCQTHPMWCTAYEGGCKNPGHSADGFFQEYIAIHHRNAMVLPSGLSAVEAAPLFCAGVTSYHGIADLPFEEPEGKWLAIIGCGGLGHLGIQYAKAKGYRVVGLDISDDQLAEATDCGADFVYNTLSDPDYVAKIKKVTSGGCHAVVNYTSSVAAYNRAPDVLRTNGVLMVVGHTQPRLTFSTIDIALGKYRIMGASNSTADNLPECINFSHKHGVHSHTTYYRSLDDIHEMVQLLTEGKVKGRLAIRFD
ncbi:hypothetical protein SBRCBS47491_007518 [Sporothrix bragantina]|uniref:Enoyl reductase (ER) domain-containing protein n=1 Tax=Sporothrix bragantina TaxID=671064 RepID=A0ABP0CF47_9PEZI